MEGGGGGGEIIQNSRVSTVKVACNAFERVIFNRVQLIFSKAFD